MTAFLTIGGALAAEEDGATSIEYALLAAMIADGAHHHRELDGHDGRRHLHQANTDLITYMPASAP